MKSKTTQNYFFLSALVTALSFAGSEVTAEPATLSEFVAGITPGTAGFFAALLSMLLLLMVVSFSVGERLWAALAALIAAYGLWFWAAEQRSQDLFLASYTYDTHLLAFTGLLIHAGLYFLGSRIIPKHHRLGRMRPVFAATAVIAICVGLLCWFVDTDTAIDLFNVSGLLVGASAIIPFLAAERLPSETLRPIFVYAILFFLPAGSIYLWLLFLSELKMPVLLDFNRVVYAWIVAFGGFMTIRRIIALREDRARVLEQALTAAQKESETNRALFEAERKYADARMAVLRQSNLLADVSHDIK